MSSPSSASAPAPVRARPSRPLLLLGGALCAALLACGVPYSPYSMHTSGSVPYWACATATPVPTEEIIAWHTPIPAGTPYAVVVGHTTPVPTETPFYRLGEFYVGETASIGAVQVRLLSLSVSGGYTLVHMKVINQGPAAAAVPLSILLFAEGPGGERALYSSEAQRRFGLPEPMLLEQAPIPGSGGELEETLALAGEHDRVALFTNLFASRASSQPIWFHGAPDPVACRHGEVAWPVPAPRTGGYAYTGALPAARPDAAAGPLPVASYVRFTTPYGCNPWNGRASGLCTSPDVWHGGLDISAYAGTPVYSPVAGRVIFAGWSTAGYGNLVIVQADLGYGSYLFMYFAHMLNDASSPLLVAAGDEVSCGTQVGYVGSTGASTGPHLHWETRCGPEGEPGLGDPLSPEDTRVWWPLTCGEGVP